MVPIVREHLEKAQRDQRGVYNRTAQHREFQPGDRVLVLVPTVECKFLATWQGPFEILEKVGEVNYKVRQPGKRKAEQIYIVNLLQKWHDQEALFSSLFLRDPPEPAWDQVQLGPDLSPHQLQQVKELVEANQDVFSSVPGCTHLIEHEVHNQPGSCSKPKTLQDPRGPQTADQRGAKEDVGPKCD